MARGQGALILVVLWIGAIVSVSAAQFPATDLYRVDYTGSSRETLQVSAVVNLTSRPGYDNQPYVQHVEIPRLYFSSIRGDGQSDIWCRDLVLDGPPNEKRVTSTLESEYSPGYAPISDAISVIRVEKDSTQRLVAVELFGEPPTRLLLGVDGLEKIGYYAWVDSFRVVLFVLSDPHELWVIDTRTREKWLAATNIGRCFRKMWWMDGTAISFVQKDSTSSRLCMLSVDDRQIRTLATMPDLTVEDYEWFQTGVPSPPPGVPGSFSEIWPRLICGRGSELLVSQPDPARGWQSVWKRWADLADFGVDSITRLIVAQAAADKTGLSYRPCLILVAADQKPDK